MKRLVGRRVWNPAIHPFARHSAEIHRTTPNPSIGPLRLILLHPSSLFLHPFRPMPAVSVVIPLYNEEDNIAELQKELAAALSGVDHEVILVDDCSKDQTLARIDRQPGVRVIEFAKNTGQSAAMYAGIQAARGDIIVLLDGDRQNDPADIPKLLEGIENGADLVCGYRANRKDTTFKRFQSRVANFVRSRFTGDGVRDTGCTLKAMRRECREALVPLPRHAPLPARAHQGDGLCQAGRGPHASSPASRRGQQIRFRPTAPGRRPVTCLRREMAPASRAKSRSGSGRES